MAQSSIATIAGIMSIFSTVVAFAILLPILNRAIQRKKKSTLYLAFSISSWILTFIFAANIYFLSERNLDWVIWCQKFVYVGVFLGCMFSFQFSQEVFFRFKKSVIIIYWVIGLSIILLTLVLDSVDVAVFPDGSDYPLLTIKFTFSILVVIYILPTLVIIFQQSLKTAKKIDEKAFQVGFRIIAFGQIMILFTFIADTLASLVMAVVNLYAILLYLTWIFPLITILCYYVGWIMPSWFRNRYNLSSDN